MKKKTNYNQFNVKYLLRGVWVCTNDEGPDINLYENAFIL